MSPADDPRPERRLLLVHAHPDDESIGTGATMAKYAAEGAQVTLVTWPRRKKTGWGSTGSASSRPRATCSA